MTNPTTRAAGFINTLATVQTAPTTHTRTLAGVTATFPVDTAQDRWRVWRWGADCGGERHTIADAIERTRETDVVWDVGAQIGLWTAFVGQRAARVVAVEADDAHHEHLRDVIARNGIDATICPVALGATAQHMAIDDERSAAVPAADGGITGRPAADLIEEGLPAPDVLKVDVQGAELAVLDGFGERLADVRLAYVEVHPHHGVEKSAVHDRLGAAGLAVDQLPTDHDREVMLRGVAR